MTDTAQYREPFGFYLTATFILLVAQFFMKKIFCKVQNQSWDVTEDVHDDNGSESPDRVVGSSSVDSLTWLSWLTQLRYVQNFQWNVNSCASSFHQRLFTDAVLPPHAVPILGFTVGGEKVTDGDIDNDQKDDGDDAGEDVAEPVDVVIDVVRIFSQ